MSPSHVISMILLILVACGGGSSPEQSAEAPTLHLAPQPEPAQVIETTYVDTGLKPVGVTVGAWTINSGSEPKPIKLMLITSEEKDPKPSETETAKPLDEPLDTQRKEVKAQLEEIQELRSDFEALEWYLHDKKGSPEGWEQPTLDVYKVEPWSHLNFEAIEWHQHDEKNAPEGWEQPPVDVYKLEPWSHLPGSKPPALEPLKKVAPAGISLDLNRIQRRSSGH